ncbi:DUF523 and DUF1722 domain-containing protein [Persicobacter psychrovividus]
MSEKLKIGISTCLLGVNIRYDGGHKNSRLVNKFEKIFDYHPICPEVGSGMSTPRPAIHLMEGDSPEEVRLVESKNHEVDYTDQMQAYSERETKALQDLVDGYILMGKSPSCGMDRIKVYKKAGQPSANKARGLFAEKLLVNNPLLPVEEEGRLHDAVLRENFIARVYIFREWKQFIAQEPSVAGLQLFHQKLKYKVMSHSPSALNQLGRMVSNPDKKAMDQVYKEYIALLMETIKQPAKKNGILNALQHVYGYFKNKVDEDEKKYLLEMLEDYKEGFVPLIMVRRALSHLAEKHENEYILQQNLIKRYPKHLNLYRDL